MDFYAEQDACFKYKLLYVIVIPLYLCRNIWLCLIVFIFFSDVDSEATEGNTENEQEDACPSTGETIVIEDKIWALLSLDYQIHKVLLHSS